MYNEIKPEPLLFAFHQAVRELIRRDKIQFQKPDLRICQVTSRTGFSDCCIYFIPPAQALLYEMAANKPTRPGN